MAASAHFTLVRFTDDPRHITGVAELPNAAATLQQLQTWAEAYPRDTMVVFDHANRPVPYATLEQQVAALEAASSPTPRLKRSRAAQRRATLGSDHHRTPATRSPRAT
jgi:hypothetical protein